MIDGVCRIAGCENRATYSDALCGKHYMRRKRHGDPEANVRTHASGSVSERIAHYGFDVTDAGCWEWRGGKSHGYGILNLPGEDGKHRSTKVCRLMFELHVGPIPEGHVVRHDCDNPPCCNPDHLRTGTQVDNMRDAAKRGRTSRGEDRTHWCRLTEAQVKEIRRLHSDGMSQAGLGRQFNVAPATIWMIVAGRNWKHLLPA